MKIVKELGHNFIRTAERACYFCEDNLLKVVKGCHNRKVDKNDCYDIYYCSNCKMRATVFVGDCWVPEMLISLGVMDYESYDMSSGKTISCNEFILRKILE